MGINVLSLFDGMACGLVALKRAGIQVDNYYASEIDPYAMKIAKKNHPEIKHIGDVTKIDLSSMPKIDLLIGGFPCQDFSIAGKGANFGGVLGQLFFTLVNIKKELEVRNPDLQFLFENVKMKKKEWQTTINEYLGVIPTEINSSLVSAQNRKRLYWANWKIEQPEDKRIILKYILETDIENKYMGGYNPTYKTQSNSLHNIQGKSNVLCANTHGYALGYISCNQVGIASDISGHDYNKRIYSSGGKAPTVNAHAGGNIEPKVAIDETHYRKLTPLECERLQTLEDGYTEGVSNTQRYKMIGNGFTISVISHILKSNPKLM